MMAKMRIRQRWYFGLVVRDLDSRVCDMAVHFHWMRGKGARKRRGADRRRQSAIEIVGKARVLARERERLE
ncbi:hypothetical protein MTY66_07770 [Mycolicibacterium sp. TY66]|nr:hypothetical protein MTY66_07770 [Mycolicibacterium sp. TY66]BCJ83185.1 hypothetical protein MTY81_45580 [Mycolicibacterium sp. TY81]